MDCDERGLGVVSGAGPRGCCARFSQVRSAARRASSALSELIISERVSLTKSKQSEWSA